MFENILNNPGLQHIAENIFCVLNYEDLELCRTVNQSCKLFLDEPMFWVKKFIRRGLSKRDQLDWTKAIQLTRHTNLEKNVLSYLKKSSKNERVVNLPCYIDEDIVRNSKKLVKKYLKYFINRDYDKLIYGDQGIIQILAPLMPNLNTKDKNGATPILKAAISGSSEIIEILAPLTENPNEPNESGVTPLHAAAANGKLEVIIILAPLIKNLNITGANGWTAMHYAVHYAAMKGNMEIIKFLVPLTDSLNSRNNNGDTPIDIARKRGHDEIVKFLESSVKLFVKPPKRSRLK